MLGMSSAAPPQPVTPEAPKVELSVSAEQVSNAAVGVLREQLHAAMDKAAEARASLDAMAQRYVAEKAEWEVEREQLLAQIRRHQESTTPDRPTRQREQLPAAVSAKAAPRKRTTRKASAST